MSNRKIASRLPAAVAGAAAADGLALQHGRRLSLVSRGGDDLVEVRGADGTLELRIRLTADGPVLQMESLKLTLKAAQDVEIECANFAVRASQNLALQAEGEVSVQGRLIRLN
jgi:hypothetical protein